MITSNDEKLEDLLLHPPEILVETRYKEIWNGKIISTQFIAGDLKYEGSSISGCLKFKVRKKRHNEYDKDLHKLFFDKTEHMELVSRNSRRDLRLHLDKYAHIFANKYNLNRNKDEYLPAQIFLDLSLLLERAIEFYYERYRKDFFD